MSQPLGMTQAFGQYGAADDKWGFKGSQTLKLFFMPTAGLCPSPHIKPKDVWFSLFVDVCANNNGL